MIQVLKSKERGKGEHGWLSSRHSFSFAEFYHPSRMGYRVLRVINEDWIDGGRGFPPHPHRDMEIFTYVVEGALEHKDSMGNSTVIRPGEVQRMSAGTGVRHSEYNHFPDRKTHLLQIWILPSSQGIPPGYGQKSFADALAREKLVLVLSQDGREGSVSLHQDADVYASRLKAGDSLEFPLRSGRGLWLQLVKGRLQCGAERLEAGDGLAAEAIPALPIQAEEEAEFLLFDLP